jgi:hypothetical protein
VTLVCAGTVLLFPDWLPEQVRRVLGMVQTPVRALVMAFGLAIVLTAVGAIVVLVVNGTDDWRSSIASIIAALPNLAITGLLVGLGAGLDAGGYAGILGGGVGASSSTVHVTDLADQNLAWWLLTIGALVVVAVFGLLVARESGTVANARQQLLVGIAVAAVVSFVGAWAASVYLVADSSIGGVGAAVGVNAWLALLIGAVGGAAGA